MSYTLRDHKLWKDTIIIFQLPNSYFTTNNLLEYLFAKWLLLSGSVIYSKSESFRDFREAGPWHEVRRHIYDLCTTNFRHPSRSTIETVHLSRSQKKHLFRILIRGKDSILIKFPWEKSYSCKLIGTPD